MVQNVQEECAKFIDSYFESIVSDVKVWRKKNTDLQNKYEISALWINTLIEMNQRMRDHIF
jgi:hypothetical protein